ncbi:MAG: ATP-binding protein [Candidatus Hydrogenedentes bacterium]|nr:ATP-binding protein [Candidatus Hydrogenedentota bacterium]
MRQKDNSTVILNARERLGHMLVEEKLISPQQLKEALANQQETGQFIGQALVELGYISEQDLASFLVRQCRIPHLNLLDYEIKTEMLDLLPYKLSREHRVLPVDKLGSILTVAMVDPFDSAVLEKIQERTGLRVKPVLCNWYDFELVFARLFGERRATEKRRDARPVRQARKPAKVEIVETEPSGVQEKARDEDSKVPTLDLDEGQAAPAHVEERGEEREVGVPLETDKAVQRVVRAAPAGELKDADEELPLPQYTFDNFFVGQINTFTYAIARAVADTPGTEYNPLFIYGDVGLGKTHLICAIGNNIMAAQPETRVIYNSAGTFSNRLIEAIQQHDVVSFREHYTTRGVVIIDDVQFLAGRERAQEEFFEIFNILYDEHKQIIVASDKIPEELDALEKRLVSRFAGGIVAGIAPPEWETRMAVLKHRAELAGCEVPEEVLSLVATRVPDDVRKLSGALRKVVAFCELLQQDITVELAQEVLDHLFENKRRKPG